MSNDLPQFEKNSQQCRPRRPIGSSAASVSQTAALLTTIGPQVVRPPDRGVIRVTRSGLPQLGQAGCSLPPTSRIKSRMANMLHLRFLGRGLRQRNAIAWRRSVAAIGLGSRKPLSGIASCALTISPISWCSSCRSCIISSEAGVA